MQFAIFFVQRTAYNIDEWRKQTGIGEAVRLDNQDEEDIDDDQVRYVVHTVIIGCDIGLTNCLI